MEVGLIFGIAISIVGLQYFLSKKKHWAFGGILPVAYILFALWMLLYQAPTISKFSLVSMLIVLLEIWKEGRKKVKRDSGQENQEIQEKI